MSQEEVTANMTETGGSAMPDKGEIVGIKRNSTGHEEEWEKLKAFPVPAGNSGIKVVGRKVLFFHGGDEYRKSC